jgi:2-iminoacetate synthase ThiH
MAQVTTYRLTKSEIEAMLQQAAQQGAREALTRIGLSDDNAPHDVRELRQLIDGWRDIKSTALKTIVRWCILGILGILSVGAYVTLGK